MRLILRDDAGMRGARAALARAPEADTGSAPHPLLVPPAPASASRHRYVVGVFAVPSGAFAAVAGLDSDVCEVLVVSDAPPGREAKPALVADGRVTFKHIGNSGALASNLGAMLSKCEPFAALGLSVRDEPGELRPPRAMQRLFPNLVHHLATGAAVVLVHAPGPEQQLRVSRALLDAKCDILLTHDVLQSMECVSSHPPSAEDCCESCATRSCGRADPSPDDTSRVCAEGD